MAAMADYLDFRPPMRIQTTLALSPDGLMVAYADDQSGQFNLSIAPVRGGDAKSLTAFTENTVRHVVWSADSKRLMCVVDRRGDENSQLYLVTAEDGDFPRHRLYEEA
jgi:Tol biopolymer transport system component